MVRRFTRAEMYRASSFRANNGSRGLSEGEVRFILLGMSQASEKVTLATLRERKRAGKRFSVLTCYDYSAARLISGSPVDCILVGDTYGEVCLGFDSTLPVTMDQMITIASAVRRGAPDVYLIGDMPYLSYQITPEDAVRNAGRFMAEAGCDCVKLEVCQTLVPIVEALSRASIPVMAHIGLRPQSVHQMGGYKAQGKTVKQAVQLIQEAKALEEAGASTLLLEAVPSELGKIITKRTELPVIGCVAGPHTDGQVVVLHDMLGYGVGHPPRAVRQYANINETLHQAFADYAADVAKGRFPIEEKNAKMCPGEHDKLLRVLADL